MKVSHPTNAIRVGITIGNPNGIGPEITARALSNPAISTVAEFVVFASEKLFVDALPRSQSWSPVSGASFLETEVPQGFHVEPGKESSESGRISAASLGKAVREAIAGRVHAIVTAPLSKRALAMAGYRFPGQTEFIAGYFEKPSPVMILIADDFRVALATTHCALSEVSRRLTSAMIIDKLSVISADLNRRFNISRARIAVCALNPHAGEGGLFGDEETRILMPALEQARALGLDVSGPFPADTIFSRISQNRYDAYFAMYHDQGLIPLKMQGFGRAVNYTAGLPIIRTSPDHGTAFDIAGQGRASAGSMEEAIKLAVRLASALPEG